MTVIVELIIAGLFLTAGDVLFKHQIHTLSWPVYAGGLAFYLIGLVFLIRTYPTENIAVASALMVIFNIIALTVVSWLWFKEPVTLLQAFGLVLAFGAIALLRP